MYYSHYSLHVGKLEKPYFGQVSWFWFSRNLIELQEEDIIWYKILSSNNDMGGKNQ